MKLVSPWCSQRQIMPMSNMNHNTQGNEISGFIIHQQKEISLRNFIRKANLTCESLLPRSTMDATSDAAFSWASFWMAIPTSARAKEGASFIPSPTFKNLTVSCVWFPPVIILTSMCWQNRHHILHFLISCLQYGLTAKIKKTTAELYL